MVIPLTLDDPKLKELNRLIEESIRVQENVIPTYVDIGNNWIEYWPTRITLFLAEEVLVNQRIAFCKRSGEKKRTVKHIHRQRTN